MDKPWTTHGHVIRTVAADIGREQPLLERTTGFEPATLTLAKRKGHFSDLPFIENQPHDSGFCLTAIDRDLPPLTLVCAFFVVRAPQDSAPHAPRDRALDLDLIPSISSE
jgi:hypothetical protein